MRAFLLVILIAWTIGSDVSHAQNYPEFDNYRYGQMYHSTWNDGWSLRSRVTPHYTHGVLDTLAIDSSINGVIEFGKYRRIRYEPTSLTPDRRIVEQWYGSWVTIQVDSFGYSDGLRTERSTTTYDGGLPSGHYRTRYNYDELRRISTSIDETFLDNTWKFVTKHGYFYDEFNNILGIDDSTLVGSALYLTTRETWDYVDGVLDEIIRERSVLPNWLPIERFSYRTSSPRSSSALEASPLLLVFDTLPKTSQAKHVTVRNTGVEAASLFSLSTFESGVFKITGLSDLPRTIMPGDSITFDIVFQPFARGDFRDSLLLNATDSTKQIIYLQGASHQGILALSSADYNFNTVVADSTKTLPLDLLNLGDDDIVLDSSTLSDPHFSIVSFVPQILGTASKLSFFVSFAPTDSVEYSSQLRLYYHDHNRSGDTLISLRGLGFIPRPDTILAVKINDMITSRIMLSPNPAKHSIRIIAPAVDILSIRILGEDGRTTLYDLRSPDRSIDLSTIPAGAAMMIIETSQGAVNKKFIIVR